MVTVSARNVRTAGDAAAAIAAVAAVAAVAASAGGASREAADDGMDDRAGGTEDDVASEVMLAS
ncbi:MAG: hypothetical protein U1F49_13495 [Rubrivivax sp.]